MTPSKLQELYAARSLKEGYVGDSYTCRAKTVRRIIASLPRAKGLDVGSADGEVLRTVTGLHDVHAVDICADFFEALTAKGYKSATQCDVQTEPLPFADDEFDWVVCGECLEHVVDTDFVLSQINRVVKLGGTFVLTVPNIRTPIGLAMLIAGYPPMLGARYRSGHVRDFTKSTALIALQNNGFRVSRVYGTEFMSPWGFHLSWLARLMPGWSSSMVFECTKEKTVSYDLKGVVSTEMH